MMVMVGPVELERGGARNAGKICCKEVKALRREPTRILERSAVGERESDEE